MDVRLMAITDCSTFSKAPGMEFHHQMQFKVLSRTLIGGGDQPTSQTMTK